MIIKSVNLPYFQATIGTTDSSIMSLSPASYDDNPWWTDIDEINQEREIKNWEDSPIKWDPRIRQAFDFTNDIIYSLRGPRQVGKTTLLKLQIREFLQNGVSPWNIMYYAFDVDNSPKNLVEVIENYLNSTKRLRQYFLGVLLQTRHDIAANFVYA